MTTLSSLFRSCFLYQFFALSVFCWCLSGQSSSTARMKNNILSAYGMYIPLVLIFVEKVLSIINKKSDKATANFQCLLTNRETKSCICSRKVLHFYKACVKGED